jgi:hypothetical protein
MRYVLILIAAFCISAAADAQLHVNVNLNLGQQPLWGPAGYDRVEYYYLPDIEAYYNVSSRTYYYQENGRWINRASLPPRYRGFDLYNSHKVVINEPTPYRNHEANRQKYASFKGKHDQQPIRDSKDERYFSNKNHPEHNNWMKHQTEQKNNGKRDNGKHDNGNDKGRGNNRGRE